MTPQLESHHEEPQEKPEVKSGLNEQTDFVEESKNTRVKRLVRDGLEKTDQMRALKLDGAHRLNVSDLDSATRADILQVNLDAATTLGQLIATLTPDPDFNAGEDYDRDFQLFNVYAGNVEFIQKSNGDLEVHADLADSANDPYDRVAVYTFPYMRGPRGTGHYGVPTRTVGPLRIPYIKPEGEVGEGIVGRQY